MYVIGQGHEHLGPGTSMVQRINWTTGEEQRLDATPFGLGSCGGSCGCDGNCGMKKGLALFDSGIDPSTFGWQEWLIVGIGGYALTSMFFGTKRGIRAAGEGIRRGRKRLAKRVAG